MIKKSMTTVLLSMLLLSGYAQESCEQTLNRATDEFNAGHFYGISAILKPCIDNGFSREQRQRAYLLLTQAYMLLDDPIGAEDSYLKLLNANPEFVAQPDREPIDVVYLSKKFTASPVFSVFGKIGSNVSFARVINDWTISGLENEKQLYSLKPGWQINGGLDWHLYEDLSLTIEAGYAFTGYKKEVLSLFQNDITEIYDRQHWISLPLSVKYSINNFKKLKPYGYIGYSTNFLLGARANLVITDKSPSSQEGSFSSEETESPPIKFTSRRTRINRSAFLGGGVRYKFGLNYFFIDARYSFGLSNLTGDVRYYDYSSTGALDYTSDALLESGATVFDFAHVDDDFRLDNLALTFGYIKPLYKPRKLKNARTKSVLRSIRKDNP